VRGKKKVTHMIWENSRNEKSVLSGNVILVDAIKKYITAWNKSDRKFEWVKKPEEIIEKIRKAQTGTTMSPV
jgi:hypothetical protein